MDGAPLNPDLFKKKYIIYKLIYRISSNNSRGRLFHFSHQKGVIIRGRRLFQIFLTGGRALNILFYYTINSKKPITSNINRTCMGFLSVSKMPRGGGGVGRLFEGGDYFKYFCHRGTSIRGRRLIEGRLLFEEIRYIYIFFILLTLNL